MNYILKTIDKLLLKLGYIKRDLSKSPLTKEEILYLFIESLGSLDETFIDESSEIKMFDIIREVEGIEDYFDKLLKRDIKRYMAAQTKDDQMIIRGAFNRTAFIKAKLRNKELMGK